MVTRTSAVAPVKLAVRFVLLAAVPLAALGWVGRRLLDQDRALEAQRVRQQLENAAALVATEVDRSLASWEDLLASAAQGRQFSRLRTPSCSFSTAAVSCAGKASRCRFTLRWSGIPK
jgi:hypothetical protein